MVRDRYRCRHGRVAARLRRRNHHGAGIDRARDAAKGGTWHQLGRSVRHHRYGVAHLRIGEYGGSIRCWCNYDRRHGGRILGRQLIIQDPFRQAKEEVWLLFDVCIVTNAAPTHLIKACTENDGRYRWHLAHIMGSDSCNGTFRNLVQLPMGWFAGCWILGRFSCGNVGRGWRDDHGSVSGPPSRYASATCARHVTDGPASAFDHWCDHTFPSG
mmetsp:Transcript_5775/g.10373  ORF Transcript_5775/g.10373 Transcript_5775/m.10373 type:complete len:214 (+) Transcript_5775:1134-1775(+)